MPDPAYAKIQTRLPSTKPVLRIFQDAVRVAVNRIEPDGRKRIFHIADALARQAMAGDVAAIREVADRLDGKAAVAPNEDGTTNLTFVVRLPAQAEPTEWAKTIEHQAVRQEQPIADIPSDVGEDGIRLVDCQPPQSGPDLDGVKIEAVERDLASVKTDPPPLADPLPVVPGGR